MACVIPVITVGSKNVPPRLERLPPTSTLPALCQGIGHMLLHLGHGAVVDQRAHASTPASVPRPSLSALALAASFSAKASATLSWT